MGLLTAFILLAANPDLPAAVEVQFAQVAPERPDASYWSRSREQTRAVVLIHGLHAHFLSETHVFRPARSPWQEPASPLVQTLAKDADVYAFSYGQNVAVEHIAGLPQLRRGIGRLRDLGYREIIVVGHSAGGVIARRFVEDQPGSGVTKVVQVCAPNTGSSLGRVTAAVRKSQEPFLRSLSHEARQYDLKQREDLRIPAHVEFVCVVGSLFGFTGDGAVSSRFSWSDDLQKQGIPAVKIGAGHGAAMRSTKCCDMLSELVRLPQSRWGRDEVNLARPTILKEN